MTEFECCYVMVKAWIFSEIEQSSGGKTRSFLVGLKKCRIFCDSKGISATCTEMYMFIDSQSRAVSIRRSACKPQLPIHYLDSRRYFMSVLQTVIWSLLLLLELQMLVQHKKVIIIYMFIHWILFNSLTADIKCFSQHKSLRYMGTLQLNNIWLISLPKLQCTPQSLQDVGGRWERCFFCEIIGHFSVECVIIHRQWQTGQWGNVGKRHYCRRGCRSK